MKALQLWMLIVMLCFSPLTLSLNSDGLSLLALKASITADPTGILSTWSESGSNPCHWVGVRCTRDRVTTLSLSNRGLTGYIPSELGALISLRRLTLSNNNFSKPIPSHLFNATTLISLDLSHNSLSGAVPEEIAFLKNLTFLDLSSNLLDGSLPEGLSQLTHLAGTLNLSYNHFSGEVPVSFGHFPVLVSLDLRYNNLTGKIPQVGSLLNQGPTAFTGNPSLCGFPLSTPCPEAQNPNVPSIPENPDPNIPGDGMAERGNSSRRSPISVPLISAVLFAVIVAAVAVSFCVVRRKRGSREGKLGKEKVERDFGSEEGQKGKFVVIDDEEGFGLELEDLLRASAYVIGKSRSGIVYKVVVAGRGSAVAPPTVVAVRRLSEADDTTWRFKDFEYEVEAIGRIRHPNIVRLRAYYYANDEKLLVSDFIRNGSLYTALHGGSLKECSPLSWAVRLKIARGIARGLTHIHECSPRKYTHGNFKSSKILLDEDLQPYISGFGLTRLIQGASKATTPSSRRHSSNHAFIMGSKMIAPTSITYPAPVVRNDKSTQKCDVYSFGIVLMELLTGRVPDAASENDSKGLDCLVRRVFREERPLSEIIDPGLLHEVEARKQVLATFHIALNCTEADPESRPKMRAVSESLDRVEFC
ncbi:hypothetical protein Nepgr_020566 [Nepenthes gracilis]|uniref:Protein kinase domain-containing protein n=1 Tax=Nepenthes gracilis TaxID=150966 RepID=A0AAD3SVJ5_NEPGR|nr:hypothetical protein Nepgr_020566 [Nepenthes gracilis]